MTTPEGPSRRRRLAAAVDVGSNSVHLLIAEIGAGRLRPVIDESVLSGLGAIVDREGAVPPEASDATLEALRVYVDRAAAQGARSITLVGTEPLRRASNRSVLQADVLRLAGRPLHVLSHDAEAMLTLLGVTGGHPPEQPLLVVDIGGGSTELILATPGGDPVVGALPTGSARLTAAFVEHDPPSWFEINALRAEAKRLVDGLPGGHPVRGVLVGGSSTNLLRVLGAERPSRTLDVAALERIFASLAARSAATLVETTGINPRRAPQLAAGAALADAVLTRYDLRQLDTSDAGLREGAILAHAIAGDAWPSRLPELVTSRR